MPLWPTLAALPTTPPPTVTTANHRCPVRSTGRPTTLRTSCGRQGRAPPSRSVWTCPPRATGDATQTTGLSSPAPPGTPARLATTSPSRGLAPTSRPRPGPAGTPSSARCASRFPLSRRAPTARPVALTWLASARPADRPEADATADRRRVVFQTDAVRRASVLFVLKMCQHVFRFTTTVDQPAVDETTPTSCGDSLDGGVPSAAVMSTN